MNAVETLSAAREARAAGSLNLCLLLCAACLQRVRDEGDPEAEFWTFTCMGNAFVARGEPESGLAYLRLARDVALEGGLTPRLCVAYHNLFIGERDAHRGKAAKRHAGVALTLYRDTGRNHAGIAALTADMAEADLTESPSLENAAHALQCWRGASTLADSTRERMVVACNWMTAASLLRLDERYVSAADLLDRALLEHGASEYAAVCMTTGARAALRMRDFERASALAQGAVSVAGIRGETVWLAQAEEVRSAALAGRQAPAYT